MGDELTDKTAQAGLDSFMATFGRVPKYLVRRIHLVTCVKVALLTVGEHHPCVLFGPQL